MEHDIVIAVLTYNSEKSIDKCITSIIGQNYPENKYDVIVFDNGSSDSTLEILKDHKIKYYSYPGLNVAQLRNKAVEHVDAPLVGFIDSDCVVDADWISTSLRLFVNAKIAVVGHKYMLPSDASFFERNWYRAVDKEVRYNELIPAGNMVISKKILKEISGFNEDLQTGEDSDLLQRVRREGYITISDPRIRNVHLGNPKNLRSFYRKELWYAIGTDWKKAFTNSDKPFFFSLAFVLLLVLSLLELLLADFKHAVFPLLGIMALAFAAAADRKINKHIDGNIFYLTLVYVVYFSARASALAYIFKLKKYKKSDYLTAKDGL